MKDKNDVVREFNEYVNMTASELEKWLKSGDSKDAGWSKDDGSGESVGHDSGRKIIAILKANPKKDPKKYTDDQVEHMRRVVAYCKRHIAQEKGPNSEKSAEEIKKTKSYASLKNWGHDPLKKLDSKDGAQNGHNEDDEAEGQEEEADEKKQSGQKRKSTSKSKQPQKKQATPGTRKSQRLSEQPKDTEKSKGTAQSKSSTQSKSTAQSKSTNGTKKSKKEDDEDADDAEEDQGESKKSGGGKKPAKGPKPGDTVSWNWGSGAPKGKVLDVKADETEITTKRGNKVSRKGDPQDPAVVLDAGKSKAIKFNHELNETS